MLPLMLTVLNRDPNRGVLENPYIIGIRIGGTIESLYNRDPRRGYHRIPIKVRIRGNFPRGSV